MDMESSAGGYKNRPILSTDLKEIMYRLVDCDLWGMF